jgi:hypothetical protein
VTFNHGVEGSSPSALTKENQRLVGKNQDDVVSCVRIRETAGKLIADTASLVGFSRAR